jgi:cyclophilin family peptidyl-prolyl cis-trans isomerase
LCCALAGAVLLAACGDGDKNGDSDGTVNVVTVVPTSAGTSAPAVSCATTGAPMSNYSEPPMTVDASKKYFATIKMDIGDIKVELYPVEAPRHVNSFVFLSREGYYDGVTFHRVLPGFVAQGGDPTGTGSGGPGYTLPLEVNPARKHLDGSLAAARSQSPDSAGSQFFLNYGPQPRLDPSPNNPGYTVFGGIVEGRDVLDKITARDPTKPGAASIQCTRINTIVIEEQ